MNDNPTLDNVLNRIAKELGVRKYLLLRGRWNNIPIPCKVACFVIKNHYPHLIDEYAKRMRVQKSELWVQSASLFRMMNEDDYVFTCLCDVLDVFGLRPPKLPKECVISPTKQLFGFDYTKHDDECIREICALSQETMNNICAIGRKPMGGSMVSYSEKRKGIKWQNF